MSEVVNVYKEKVIRDPRDDSVESLLASLHKKQENINATIVLRKVEKWCKNNITNDYRIDKWSDRLHKQIAVVFNKSSDATYFALLLNKILEDE